MMTSRRKEKATEINERYKIIEIRKLCYFLPDRDSIKVWVRVKIVDKLINKFLNENLRAT